jgi:hypothetical protein
MGGRWRGFALAVAFGLAVEAFLLAWLVWDEMFGPPAMGALGGTVVFGWILGVAANRRWLAGRRRREFDAAAGDLFPGALAQYLQGNWFVAEQQCRDLIRLRADDAEARLLLATLLRHTGRPDEAGRELDALAKFDTAAKWRLEMADERRRLEELEEADEEETAEEAIPAAGAIRRAA